MAQHILGATVFDYAHNLCSASDKSETMTGKKTHIQHYSIGKCIAHSTELIFTKKTILKWTFCET